jgi:drug/metabolite transporter (DMT)-like permease
MTSPAVSHSVRGAALLGGLALAWGSNFLWIKVGLGGFTPVGLTFLRLVVGASVLLLIIAARRHRLPGDLRTWGQLAVLALLGNAAPYLLFALGETRVDSAIAGALNSTTPLWTLLLGLVIGTQRRPVLVQVLGFLIGFGGCLVIFAPWQATDIDAVGALVCLAAALCYGISYVYIGRYLANTRHSPLVLATGQLLLAPVWLAALLPFGGLSIGTPSMSALAALLVLGIVGTGIAHVINYALIRHDGAASASLVGYLLPVVAIAFGAVFASEPVTLTLAFGTAAVLVGVALSRLRR